MRSAASPSLTLSLREDVHLSGRGRRQAPGGEDAETGPLPPRQQSAALHTAGEAVLLIEDTGQGIGVEVLTRLFEPFTTSKPNGMGLGLSIAKRIVEEHGGRLLPHNHPGVGLTMEIRLPVNTS
ncbi:hypothetical protein HS125_03730 [bacterium]|nr:hypothetical protein [bacterium]